jgi:hypothetical protein
MRYRDFSLPIMACLVMPPAVAIPAQSQTIEARRIPNAQFVRIEMIKFKPGGEDRAFELEDKYLSPAWAQSGLARPLEIHTQTGPWDRIYVYSLAGGLADMEWQVSKERAAFMNALARVAGSNQNALRIMGEWDALVERRETTIGHEHPSR